MNVRTVRVGGPEEILAAVDAIITERLVGGTAGVRHHALVLFEGNKWDLQASFLDRFMQARKRKDLVMTIRGEIVTSLTEFYAECNSVFPLSYELGDSLVGLRDMLWGEGLADDPTAQTYWIWRNAYVLFVRDTENFKKIFAIMADTARLANVRFEQTKDSGIAAKNKRRGELVLSPVTILLTGLWEAVGAEALREDSFLYRLPENLAGAWLDLSTRFVTLRVS